MDKCGSDAEFDSYWDYEAKNKNRNRIRVGRQYQASVPPLLKPGEKDGRKSEDLETLKWKPDQLSDQQLDQYFSMAKAVTSFAKAIENCCDPDKSPDSTLHAAIKGLTEFVTSHHPCHRDAGCKVPVSSSFPPAESAASKSSNINDWTTPEAHLFAQAIESCGKNFCAIKKEYLPWKPVCSLIEYYYYYGKSEKPDTVAASVPFLESTLCKVKKIEAVASCSRDNSQQVTGSHTKEEPSISEEVKEDDELRATAVETSTVSESKRPFCSPASQMDADNPVESTVGSLKFFLGGRLVLKLNAQQESGTRCQWVQSNDTPKNSHQAKKVKHRRKEMAPPDVAESPKNKKKSEDHASLVTEGAISATKKAKLRTYDTGLLPLCSMSWTPPVADGPESVELEDGSSKTSEGCVSPIVTGLRNVKSEVRTDASSVDSKRKMGDSFESDRKSSWLRNESNSAVRSSDGNFVDDGASSSMPGFSADKSASKSFGEDPPHCYEVLNPKSALTRMKGSCFLPRAAHSSSPSAKLFNKWPSPSADFSDKVKSSPSFHSPNSRTCSTSSESSIRDYVLDLSARFDACENRTDANMSQDTCCRSSPIGCTENCSSSEGSPHTPCSANECTYCCKSSNCSAYHVDVRTPVHESKDLDNQLNSDAEQFDECGSGSRKPHNKLCSASVSNMDDVREGCCYNPSTSCASPKCCKSYSSKEHACNKDDSANSSPNTVGFAPDDGYSMKMPSWLGSQVNSLVQMYPHCYPYYVTYGVNPSTLPNSPAAEIPLDLSSNGNNKEEKLLPDNVPDVQTDMSKNSADALDRGMLYQLLKNKVTK